MTATQLSTETTDQPIRVTAPLVEDQERILTPEALRFVAGLERRFGRRRRQLLGLREDRQRRFNDGEQPGFRAETAELRSAEWRVKQPPANLRDRRVEITGPVDRQSVVDALGCGASCFIADFEDAHAPAWDATIAGQINLYDAVRGTLCERESSSGPQTALIVRPRGWHLPEKHLEVDGQAVSASLFDFGLFMFHNGLQLLEQGKPPCFCLPKLESYIEARLWVDLFAYAEESLGLNQGCICCTVAIETLPAAFEMEEILYTLRDYAVGLDFGRRNYIFSFIKRFHADPARVLPDRSQITVESGFVQACSQLLIGTSHRRGAHASCGITALLPPDDTGTLAGEQLYADLEGALTEGYDGVRVAHSTLVAAAKREFERIMSQANRPDRQLHELNIEEADLLQIPPGSITQAGLDANIGIGLRYLTAWLAGQGSVPINRLIEDAASAEVARAQIWQWIHHPQGILDDGREITFELFSESLARELEQIRRETGGVATGTDHHSAAELFSEIVANNRFIEFFTLPAYQTLA